MQLEVTFTDPGAFTRPWGFTVDMELGADTEMLEAVCETDSADWEGSLSEAAVTVPPEVLASYVGSYTGIYAGRERTFEVSVADGELFATIAGISSGAGLGSPGLDEGAPRPLVPRSETLFEGLGLAFRFIINEEGEVTDLMVIHVSGDYEYSRVE